MVPVLKIEEAGMGRWGEGRGRWAEATKSTALGMCQDVCA